MKCITGTYNIWWRRWAWWEVKPRSVAHRSKTAASYYYYYYLHFPVQKILEFLDQIWPAYKLDYRDHFSQFLMNLTHFWRSQVDSKSKIWKIKNVITQKVLEIMSYIWHMFLTIINPPLRNLFTNFGISELQIFSN